MACFCFTFRWCGLRNHSFHLNDAIWHSGYVFLSPATPGSLPLGSLCWASVMLNCGWLFSMFPGVRALLGTEHRSESKSIDVSAPRTAFPGSRQQVKPRPALGLERFEQLPPRSDATNPAIPKAQQFFPEQTLLGLWATFN